MKTSYYLIALPINGNTEAPVILRYDNTSNKKLKELKTIAKTLGSNFRYSFDETGMSKRLRTWDVTIIKGREVEIGKVLRKKIKEIEESNGR